jgi:hypothetical protein
MAEFVVAFMFGMIAGIALIATLSAVVNGRGVIG